MSLIWPDHACDGTVLSELIAYGLFLAPLHPELVYKHYVVGLSYRELLIVRGERHRAYNVRLVVLIGGPRGELVLPDSVLVKEMHNAVSSGHGHSLGVGGPANRGDLLHAVNRRLEVLLILYLHILRIQIQIL